MGSWVKGKFTEGEWCVALKWIRSELIEGQDVLLRTRRGAESYTKVFVNFVVYQYTMALKLLFIV